MVNINHEKLISIESARPGTALHSEPKPAARIEEKLTFYDDQGVWERQCPQCGSYLFKQHPPDHDTWCTCGWKWVGKNP